MCTAPYKVQTSQDQKLPPKIKLNRCDLEKKYSSVSSVLTVQRKALTFSLNSVLPRAFNVAVTNLMRILIPVYVYHALIDALSVT